MTKNEWARRKRAEYTAAGKCRCGGRRARGRKSCKGCLAWEWQRRTRATQAGLCLSCRKRKRVPGRVHCKQCRAAANHVGREGRRLVRLAGAPTLAQELRSLADEHIDPELACLLVARVLERQGRTDEAAVLKLELGQLLIRAALHEVEHPDPVALGKQLSRALGTHPAGTSAGTSVSVYPPRAAK